MFKNKHVIIALLVAPILSLLAFFGVDAVVSEKPHKAVAGASYELIAKPNCRYESGLCGLKNGDVEIVLRAVFTENDDIELWLDSPENTDGVKVALVDSGAGPFSMLAVNEQASSWRIKLARPRSSESKLQLAVSIQETLYFAEVTTIFMQHKPLFEQQER